MSDLISVIIPIYNVKSYLEYCLNSVLNQTYSNIEVVLIDDGSVDGSGEICDKYACIDSRIIVVHKTNGGVSAARNDGVKISSGKYIVFVDSDDYIANNYIEELYRLLKKYDADIAQVGSAVVYGYSHLQNECSSNNEIIFNQKEAIISSLEANILNDGAWAKIYSRNLLVVHPYPVNRIYEDLAVVFDILLDVDRVVYGDACLYYYVQHSNSIMNSSFNDNQFDEYHIVNESTSKVLDKYPDLADKVNCRRAASYFAVLFRILSSKETRKYNKYIKLLKQSIFQLSHSILSFKNHDNLMKIKFVFLRLNCHAFFLFQNSIINIKKLLFK